MLLKEDAAMHPKPKDPHKEQDPAPEPIDPPNDGPPAELPGDPMDKPNVLGVKKPARGGLLEKSVLYLRPLEGRIPQRRFAQPGVSC